MLTSTPDNTLATPSRSRILVVEDEKMVRDFCRLLLRSRYNVATAENGRVAADMLLQETFDLALIDLQMPEMDGLSLLRHIRERHTDVDTIILTAHGTVDTAREALKLGALDYLSKPVDTENLERTVRIALELRRMRQEKERLSDLVVMYQFSQAIASSLDMTTQVDQISEFLQQRFAPETLAISLHNPEIQELNLLRLYKSRRNSAIRQDPVPLAPECDDETMLKAHMKLVDGPGADKPTLFAGVVLRTQDQPIGYLHMARRNDQPDFDASERKLLSVIASQIAASLDNARLHQQMKDQHWQIIEALTEAIDARDAYTFGHSKQVTRYAVRLAEAIGLPPQRIELLRYAALLHDIGKIGIRDHILLKPGPLDDDEFAIMKEHPTIGGRILKKVRTFRDAIQIVEGHHERFDGKGYPNGLTGEQLLIETRILSIADAFEALTADRAYRPAMEDEKALQILQDGRGKSWDADLVDTFIQLIRAEGATLRIGPRLRQDRLPFTMAERAVNANI